ncbi:hypothetical protein AAMO2058_001515900 [Amorphochlora amoebiformis]
MLRKLSRGDFESFRYKKRVGDPYTGGIGMASVVGDSVPKSRAYKSYLDNREPNATIDAIKFGILREKDFGRISHVEAVNSQIYLPNTKTQTPYGPLDTKMGANPQAKKDCPTCGLDWTYCPGHFGHVSLHVPVFHIGYVKEVHRVLKVICKSCGHILLPKEKKASLLKAFDHASDTRAKSLLWLNVQKQAVKYHHCFNCGSPNGAVKRYKGEMKFYHDRSNKKHNPLLDDLMDEFNLKFAQLDTNQDGTEKKQKNPGVGALVGKHSSELLESLALARDDIDPMRAYKLLSMIPDADVKLLNQKIENGRPEDLVANNMLIPPVCLRPTSIQGSGTNEDDLTVKMADIIHVNTWVKTHMRKGGDLGMLIENWNLMQQHCAQFVNSDTPGLPKDRDTKPIRALVQRLKGKQGRFRGNLSGKRVDFSARTVISPDPNLSVEEVGVPELCARTMTFPERVTKHNISFLRQCVRNGPWKHPGANVLQITSQGVKKLLKYADGDYLANNLNLGDIVDRHLIDGDIVLFNRQPSLHRISIMAHRARVMPWRTFRFNECVCNPYNADFDGDEMNLHLPQTQEAKAEAFQIMAIKNNLVTPRHGAPLICAIQDFITASYLITQKDAFFDKARFSQLVSHMCWKSATRVEIPPPVIVKPIRLWTGKQVITVLLRPNSSPEWPVVNLKLKANNYDTCKDRGYMCPRDGFILIRNSELLSGNLDKSCTGGKTKGLVNNLIRFHSVDHAAGVLNRLAKLCARYLGTRGFSIGITDVTPSTRVTERKQALIKQGYAKCHDFINKFKTGKLEADPGCTVVETVEANCNGKLSEIRSDSGKMCLDELDYNNNPTLIMAVSGSKGSKLNIAQMVACVGQQTVNGKRAPEGFVNRTLPHFEKGARTPEAKGFVQNSYYTGLTATEFFFHTMAGREGLVDTAVKTAETGYLQRRLVKAMEDFCVLYDGSVRSAETRVVQFSYGDDGLDPAMMVDGNNPLSFKATLNHIQAKASRSRIENKRENKDYKSDIPTSQHLDDELKNATNRVGSKEFSMCSLKWKALLDKFINQQSKRAPSKGCLRGLHPFVDMCLDKYKRAQAEPGTAVGAIAAQSIGEPGTQMTLKTFHFAGVASMNITMGVPRIKEIINATAAISSPIITAPLESSNYLTVARIVKGRIEKTTLGDITSYIEEVYKPNDCYLEIKLDMDHIDKLQLEVDAEVCRDAIASAKKLKVKDNAVVKEGSRDTIRVYPTLTDRTKILFSLKNLKNKLPQVGVCGVANVKRAVINEIEFRSASDDGGTGIMADSNPAKSHPFQGDFSDSRFSGVSWRISVKDGLALLSCKGIQAKGTIDDHKLLRVDFQGKQGMPSSPLIGSWKDSHILWSNGLKWKAKHYHLLVEGYGLLDVMGTPGVRGLETVSNHIAEMEAVLGIEAARLAIIVELRKTMGAYNLNVDSRHFSLLADVMTYTGKVLGITRGGMAKMDKSVLMLASFEDTTHHLFNAAVHGHTDSVSGVSECVIIGKPVPCGTGVFELVGSFSGAEAVSEVADLGPPLVDRSVGRFSYV